MVAAFVSLLFAIHGKPVEAITHDLVKYPKSKMTRLSLKKVLTAKLPSGAGSLQGFALTSKYYVLIMRPPGQEDHNQVVVIRRSDNKNVTSVLGNPVYNMSHGNDATWNEKNNEVIVIDGGRKVLVRLDANTFKKKGVAKLVDAKGQVQFGSGIAYDGDHNEYHMSAGPLIRSFNSKNQLIFSFNERHNQVNQGLAYNNGYLYRPTWESAGTYASTTYDDVFKKHTTIIYQFGLDGSFTHAYYIDNPLYEVESMDFDENNIPYLAFNGPSGNYSIYKVTDPNLLKQLRQSYTISYFDNGGSGAPKEQTAYVGIGKTLSNAKPTRSGYTFLGWSTNKSASKASYSAGAKHLKAYGSKNTNVKLYAVWQQNTYTIRYDANGGSNAPAAQVVPQTETAIVSNIKPTRSGYTFLGWSTNKGATVASYRPSTTYSAKKTVTLYAIWKSSTYRIIYNANGGSGAPATQTATGGRVISLSKVQPTRSGYTFLGWSDSQNATSAKYVSGSDFTGNSDITLYAVWKAAPNPTPTPLPTPVAQTITVTYDANGGSSAPIATTAEIGKLVLSSTKPTRSDYTFIGWSVSKGGTAADYQPGAKYNGAVSITLFAVWRQQNITVAFDVNGGSNAPATQAAIIGQPFTLSATIPTRDNYKFLGWNIDPDSKDAKYAPGEQVSFESDVRLYAIWELESKTISFDANGGTNAPLPISIAESEVVLPQARPARSGYLFIGWATDKDSTAASYQPGDIIKDAENVKLYAVWQIITPTPIVGTADSPIDSRPYDKDESIDDTTEVNGGEDDDSAVVTIEETDKLPATGPIEITVASIACVCIVCGLSYWAISKRQLDQLYRSVRSSSKTRKN